MFEKKPYLQKEDWWLTIHQCWVRSVSKGFWLWLLVVKLPSGCHFAFRISRNIPSRTSYKNAAKPLSREIVTRQWFVVKTAVSSRKNYNVFFIEAEWSLGHLFHGDWGNLLNLKTCGIVLNPVTGGILASFTALILAGTKQPWHSDNAARQRGEDDPRCLQQASCLYETMTSSLVSSDHCLFMFIGLLVSNLCKSRVHQNTSFHHVSSYHVMSYINVRHSARLSARNVDLDIAVADPNWNSWGLILIAVGNS